MATGTYRALFQVGDNAIATFSITYDPDQYVGIPDFESVEISGYGELYSSFADAVLIRTDLPTRNSYATCAEHSSADFIIGDGITKLNNSMMYGFVTSHHDVYIGSGITELPYNCFGILSGTNYYFYMDHVYFPSGCNVRNVGNNAFRGQTFLETIGLPNDIEEYGSYCFYDCKSLTYFADGNNTIDGIINENSFAQCLSLQHLTFTENTIFQNEVNPTALPFALAKDAGIDCDEDGNLYTYIHGYIGVAQILDWRTLVHRHPQYNQQGEEIYRLMHNNSMHVIRGYDSGHLPQKHKGNIYWLRFVADGDPKQSPLVIRHKGTLHYISK